MPALRIEGRPHTRKMPKPLPLIRINLLLRHLAQLDSIRTIHLLRDDLDLLGKRLVQVVQELEAGGALASGDDGLGEGARTDTTFGPVVGHDGGIGSACEGLVADEFELGGGVGTIRV